MTACDGPVNERNLIGLERVWDPDDIGRGSQPVIFDFSSGRKIYVLYLCVGLVGTSLIYSAFSSCFVFFLMNNILYKVLKV